MTGAAIEDERRGFHVDGQLGRLGWSEFGAVLGAAFGRAVGAFSSQANAMTFFFIEEIHDGGWFSLGADSSLEAFSALSSVLYCIGDFMKVEVGDL